MKLLRSKSADPAKQGSVLLLSFMVLIVVVTIVTQISIGTMTDARVARNDLTLARMDLAIESAMMQARIQLRDDGAADAEADGGGDSGAPAVPDIGDLGSSGEEGDSQEVPADKKADFPPERTELNQISLRILIQDEDSKINVLNMLAVDEERAEEAFQRVVRVLDLFREGTEFDVSLADAQEMAEVMRRHMLERDTQLLPRPHLLSDSSEDERRGFPLGMREFLSHEEIPEVLFMDFRDENDVIVHSIESFLTVWSSPRLYSGSGGSDGSTAPTSDEGAPESDAPTTGGSSSSDETTGGYAVNVNTAPPVVLKSLFDDRVVNPAFWDEVIEHRNLEDEEAMKDEDGERREPIYDEFGEEELELQFFGTTEDLVEMRSWGDFDGELQARIKELLTTKSSTFSIIITARRPTSANEDAETGMDPRDAARQEEDSPALKRVVRSVVWRHQVEDEVVVTPIVPWEILPSSPYEVLDYPEEDR
ncbi:MAG: hypothetical protein H6831_04675 [Planctomycetes bacterium]|nr:hypothetical protein [Planctomycetota bacterium]MCB9903683.1 hypothetical protein [Planctomycetota bacterium]